MMKKIILAALLAALTFFSAVGLVSPAQAAEKVTFMLDWYPNPDHVPIYLAQSEGLFAQEGLDVEILVPADPNDPLKLVAAGRLDFAVSYQPSVHIAKAQGLPVISIGALVQHPLSSILYLKSSGLKTPADFKGRKIGYSVEPLYRVLFEAVAAQAGLKTSDYETIRLGFNLSPSLLSGQVDAVCGAFRNYEAVQIELEGRPVGIFALEEHGIPDFYELVIIANTKTVKENPAKVQALMKALTAGIERTVKDPEASFSAFLKLHPDLSDELNRRAFKVTRPFFEGSPHQDPQRWVEMQDFMLAHGLIDKTAPLEDLVWMNR